MSFLNLVGRIFLGKSGSKYRSVSIIARDGKTPIGKT
jgi:hypothetical protein